MVLSLPRDAASKMLGSLAVHLLLILLYTWIACGNENPASLMRRTFLNDDIVEGLSGSEDAQVHTGRLCYLFSKEDKMVEWTDITEHAEEATQMSWMVEKDIFQGSAHCAHISVDEERYVRAVNRVWTGEKKPQNDAVDEKRIKTKL